MLTGTAVSGWIVLFWVVASVTFQLVVASFYAGLAIQGASRRVVSVETRRMLAVMLMLGAAVVLGISAEELRR